MKNHHDVLDIAMAEILGKNNTHAYSTLTFIKRNLIQFRLYGSLEVHDVLVEAYLRGKDHLKAGKPPIRNPHSWLKGTAFNIIREKARQRQKQQFFDLSNPSSLFGDKLAAESSSKTLELKECVEVLLKALKTLEQQEPDAYQLINLRTVRGLSWDEIQQILFGNKRSAPKATTLRQRAARARKHLRRIFHEFYDRPPRQDFYDRPPKSGTEKP